MIIPFNLMDALQLLNLSSMENNSTAFLICFKWGEWITCSVMKPYDYHDDS